ncbi:S8 family peptidase [Sphaerobacter thermophilus]|jgi:subtilisin family serine protease|uniref:Peptidase S8 and S53 subtilisin kexin sedolisin n=1 Tax=Sphaerobacter thermophilus (strain ATCC 49802 / DSM 20745 / KCCM 41009 / NCIMB 13125 / S 6022) TaxID=479434 RepID=D1C639_SPHTD|nr:S8 family serine peptidase [Sphaerobacter thermophilus]ACZ37577.1 peptidase S8 and S53 subtilisin kexin sedolisin [Sphaerobacter thermophilus DSM 20745]PZN63086.1 MAG: peptidase S8/S53 subtilisin kexin sedolisin [Sphaerobacter thermophilus]
MRRILTLAVLLALTLSQLALPASAAGPARSYLILTQGNNIPPGLASQVESQGGTVTRAIPEVGVLVAQSADAGFASKAARLGGVRSVVPNVKLRWTQPVAPVTLSAAEAAAIEADGVTDPFLALQWGHTAVKAQEAWAKGVRGAGVRVAVLDTGIDASHPDLAGQVNQELSISFVPGEDWTHTPGTGFSHGTHVAGTIAAAADGSGAVGIAPEAELVGVKVLSDAEGTGTFEAVIAGIVYAANIDADIINMSLGAVLARSGYCDEEGCVSAREVQELMTALGRATTYAYQQGTTIIASAGNDAINGDKDKDGLHVPSDAPHVLSISATGPLGWALDPSTDLDVPAFYTNYGRSVIDFAAPGGNVDFALEESGLLCFVAGALAPCWVFDLVFSTIEDGGYGWAAGTSMAAPHVSGVAALIISQNGGSMKPQHVERDLRAAADDLGQPGNDPFYGKGRVNAERAIR